ncbi:MAG: hypothetical protein KatS3mg050_4186 [Litorilinea sp.]|nr:MAG: hypothetical protein KatS3mg050_4186 [Litorilinea sp.]
MPTHSTHPPLSRRTFLRWSLTGTGGLLLVACAPPTVAPATSEEHPTQEATAEAHGEATAEATHEATATADAGHDDVQVLVRDVVEYHLEPQGWEGPYGSVTFRLHEGRYQGEPVYYIRTDASDPNFAQEVGLVYVPLLNAAQGIEQLNKYYRLGGDRLPVLSMIPGDEQYSSLFQVFDVTVEDESLVLESEEALLGAVEAGQARLEPRLLFVNYPLIRWPGGGLTVDPELKEVLPGGQLIDEPDLEHMTVTMKLHQCFPGSRYILTDTSSAPMAPMMNVPASVPMQQLKEKGGTDEIWVFGNGIQGPGVMGFQPAIFDNKAGQPAWSPFWDHYTVLWKDESKARVLRSSAEVRELIAAGDLQEFNGVPDTHPEGFVVNCPAPILAPNTFEG